MKDLNVSSETTELRFTCLELAEIGGVCLPIFDRLKECGALSEAVALRLKVALQEAVMNGFEHGNLELCSEWKEEFDADGEDRFSAIRRERLNDPRYAQRALYIQSRFDGSSLEIVVRDEGQGFPGGEGEFTGGLTPLGDVSVSGRGFALMSSAVDLMRFGCNGSEITLIKHLRVRGGA